MAPLRLEPARGRNKYGAVPTTVDGIRFDSTKESRRYGELRLLEKAGLIRDLELQPRFPIDVVDIYCPSWNVREGLAYGEIGVFRCGVFTADFRYVDVASATTVVEDAKSGPTRTTAYRLRKRLVEAIHGVRITEV